MNNINYQHFGQPQQYLKDTRFTNKMRVMLFNLRCNTVRGIKNNFHGMYTNNKCDLCGYLCYSQIHCMECEVLKKEVTRNSNTKYEHIYGSVVEQIEVTNLFIKLIEARYRLMEIRPTGANMLVIP